MKKFVAVLSLFVMVAVCGFVFSACKKDYSKGSIYFNTFIVGDEEMSFGGNEELIYTLGDRENNEFAVSVVVSGLDNTAIEASVSNDIANVVSTKSVGDKTNIYLKANKRGSGELLIRTIEGDISNKIQLKINQPIEKLEQKNEKYIILLDNTTRSIDLNLETFFDVTPTIYDNVQTKKFSLVGTYTGVSLSEDGELTVSSNATEGVVKVFVKVGDTNSDKLSKTVDIYLIKKPTLELLESASPPTGTSTLSSPFTLYNNIGNESSKEVIVKMTNAPSISFSYVFVSDDNALVSKKIKYDDSQKSTTFNVCFVGEYVSGKEYSCSYTYQFDGYTILDLQDYSGNKIECDRINFSVYYDTKVTKIDVNSSADYNSTDNLYEYMTTIYKNVNEGSRLKLKFNAYPKNSIQKNVKISYSKNVDYLIIQNSKGDIIEMSQDAGLKKGQFDAPETLTFWIDSAKSIIDTSVVLILETEKAKTQLTLNIKEGVSSVDFVGVRDKSKSNYSDVLQDSDNWNNVCLSSRSVSNENTQELIFEVSPSNADISVDDFELSCSNVFLAVQLVEENSKKFLVVETSSNKQTNTCYGYGNLTVRAKNLSSSFTISTDCINDSVKCDDDISVTCDGPNQNSNISSVKTSSDELEVYIKVGAVVEFAISPDNDYCNILFEKISRDDGISEIYQLTNSTAGEKTFNLSIPYFSIENGKKVENGNKTVTVKAHFYYPIQAVIFSRSSLSVSSLSSVGYFNKTNASGTFLINILTSDESNTFRNKAIRYLTNYFKSLPYRTSTGIECTDNSLKNYFQISSEEGYKLENETENERIAVKIGNANDIEAKNVIDISCNESGYISFTVKDKSVDKIQIIITQFGMTYITTLRLNVSDVKQVETIKVSNISEVSLDEEFDYEIVKNVSYGEKSAQIVASAFPTDSFNKQLVYEIFDDEDTLLACSESEIKEYDENQSKGYKIDSDGRVSWKENGINGYIRISSKDCWQRINGVLQPVAYENNIIKIKFEVQDGTTESTAIEVYSWKNVKDLIKDNKLDVYVKLGCSFELDDNFEQIETLNAGIDGNGFEISNVTKPLIKTNNGTIHNLTVQIAKEGALCEINNGVIGLKTSTANDCDIYVYGSVGETSPSYVICGKNTGTIQGVACGVDVSKSGYYLFSNNEGTIKDCAYFGSVSNDTYTLNFAKNNSDGTTSHCMVLKRGAYSLTNFISSGNYDSTYYNVIYNSSTSITYDEEYPCEPNFKNINFNIKESTDNSKFIQIDNLTVAISYYSTDEILSNYEKSRLSYLNSYSLFSLTNATLSTFNTYLIDFEFYKYKGLSSGDDATDATYEYKDYYQYNSSNGKYELVGEQILADGVEIYEKLLKNNKYIKVESGRLVSCGVCEDEHIVVRIVSKQDGSYKDFKFFITNPIGNLDVYKSTNDSDPTTLLKNGESIRFKRKGYEQIYTTLLAKSIELGGEKSVSIKVDDFSVENKVIAVTNYYDSTNGNTSYSIDDNTGNVIVVIGAISFSYVPPTSVNGDITVTYNGDKYCFVSSSGRYSCTIGAPVTSFVSLEQINEENKNKNQGLRSLYFSNAGEYTYQLFLSATDPLFNSDLKEKIKEKYTRKLSVTIYNGAENISTSTSSQTNEPYDKFAFEVVIKTDKIITTPATFDDLIKTQLYGIGDNGKEKLELSDYFTLTNSVTASLQDALGFTTYKCAVVMDLINKFSGTDRTFYVEFTPNETPAGIDGVEVEFVVLPQSIYSLSVDHYHFSDTKLDDNVNNTLAPGENGILKVNFTPYYSNLEKFVVEIESPKGYELTLEPTIFDGTNYVVQKSGYEYDFETETVTIPAKIGNGYNNIIYNCVGTEPTGATLNLKTQTPALVTADLTYKIKVKAYLYGVDDPEVKEVDLTVKYVPTATVTIGGKEKTSLGRATWNDFQIDIIANEETDFSVTGEIKNGSDWKNAESDAIYGVVIEYDPDEYTQTQASGGYFKRTYTGRVYIGALFGLSSVAELNSWVESEFGLLVRTSTTINGKNQSKEAMATAKIQNVVVTGVSLKGGSADNFDAFVNIKSKLDFGISISKPQQCNDNTNNSAVVTLKNQANQITTSFSKFVVNNSENISTVVTLDSTEKTQKFDYFNLIANNEKIYVKGLNKGSSNCSVVAVAKYDTRIVAQYEYDFSIDVEYYTTEDKPIEISSVTEFEKYIINNKTVSSTKLDYILMNDLEFEDWKTIEDTSNIASLDGNNKLITIKSFANVSTQVANLSIFENVSSSTTLKNLTINYQLDDLSLTQETVNVAGLAITNEGIITNCQILSTKTSKTGGITLKANGKISLSGFVVKNDGYITNSRVGLVDKKFKQVIKSTSDVESIESKYTEIELSDFYLVCDYDASGFVQTNNGTISSCYFCGEIDVVSDDTASQNAKVSGFATTNNGIISASYSRGVGDINPSSHYTITTGIKTRGVASGFVYANNSEISDCYSMINLHSMAKNIAGFVFSNNANATIDCCVACSNMKINTTSNACFCGVSDTNVVQNYGTIKNCYYHSNGKEVLSNLASKIAAFDSDNFYGFCFISESSVGDGVWVLRDYAIPDLYSANDIAISVRVESPLIDENGQPILIYLEDYEYGDENNPIIIRNAEEFNSMFVQAPNSQSSKFYDDNQVSANYRLVSDIDLGNLKKTTQDQTLLVNTTNVILTARIDEVFGNKTGGILDGNKMTIENVDIVPTAKCDSFGLFAELKNGATIKNLDLTVVKVGSGSANKAGALVGKVSDSIVANCGAVAVNDDSSENNIVRGYNIAGGLIGIASGKSTLSRLSAGVSVQSTCTDCLSEVYFYDSSETNNNISYAGGVVGIIDVSNDCEVCNLVDSGKISVSGFVVGGVAGYIGKNTIAKELTFEIILSDKIIEDDLISQSIYSHYGVENKVDGYVGGIVGELLGELKYPRLYHIDQSNDSTEESKQESIEKSIYKNRTETDSYKHLFEKGNACAIGGIVGIVHSNNTKISYGYCKADILSKNAKYVGGFIGKVAEECKVEVEQVYYLGQLIDESLNSKANVGLFIGFVETKNEDCESISITSSNSFAVFEKDGSTELDVFGFYDTSKKINNIASFNNGCFVSSSDSCISMNSLKTTIYNGVTCINVENLFGDIGIVVAQKELVFNVNSGWNPGEWNISETSPELLRSEKESIIEISNLKFNTNVYKMLNNPTATFILVDDIESGKFIINNSNVSAIYKLKSYDFKGSLSPKSGTLTFVLSDGIELTESLFGSITGASISNITFSGIKLNVSGENENLLTNYGILAASATNVKLENISFKNCVIDMEDPSKVSQNGQNVGIAFGAVNSVTLQKVTIEGCSITFNTNSKKEVSVGLFAGKQTGNLTTQCLVIKKGESGNGNAITYSAENSTNVKVGGAVGYSNYFSYQSIDEADKSLTVSDLTITTNDVNKDALLFVGSLVGCANTLKFELNTNFGIGTSEAPINLKFNEFSVKYIKIGGIAGKAVIFNSCGSDVYANILGDGGTKKSITSNNINIGGLAGQSCNVSVETNKTTVSLAVKDLEFKEITSGSFTFGSAFGYVVGDCKIERIKSLMPTNSISLVTDCTNSYAGLIGNINNSGSNVCKITNCINESSFSIVSKNNKKVYAGSFIGYENFKKGEVELDSCHSFGNITLEITTEGLSNKEIYIGGLIGLSLGNEGETTKNLIIQNSFAGGDIIIEKQSSDSTVEDSYLCLGGFVGRIMYDKNVKMKDNYSFTSIKNYALQSDNIHALIGSITGTIDWDDSESSNYFCPQLSLAVEDCNATGLPSSKFTSKIYSELAGDIAALTNPIENTIYTFSAGTKFNPSEITGECTLTDNNYYVLKANVAYKITLTELSNLIADGVEITGEITVPTKFAGILSGFKYVTNSCLFGVSGINKGYLFGLNIVSDGINDSYVGGICFDNSGYIGYSSTDCQFTGKYVAGLAFSNSGFIESCMSAGSINDSDSAGFVCDNVSVALKGGYIANSYCITHVENGIVTATNGGYKNFYYDQDITEKELTSITGIKNINLFRVKTTDGFGCKYNVWTYSDEQSMVDNYGCPYLNIGTYMKNNTSCSDGIYVISLKNLHTFNDSKCYVLKYDLHSDKTKNFTEYSNAIGSQKFVFNGNDKIIIINSGDGGLFDFIENTKISNLTVIGKFSSSSNDYIGAIANKARNSTIDNCTTVVNIENISTKGVAGGIIGIAEKCIIKNCYNNYRNSETDKQTDVDTVYKISGETVGGIVGIAKNECTIKNCENSRNLEGSIVGGIAGKIIDKVTIESCKNFQNIGAKEVTTIYFEITNGKKNDWEITFNWEFDNNVSYKVEYKDRDSACTIKRNNLTVKTKAIYSDSYNYGISYNNMLVWAEAYDVNVYYVPFIKASSVAGGIVGISEITDDSYTNEIKYSENHIELNGTSAAGGICGTAKNTKFTECTNKGPVTASGEGGIAGGICGTASGTIKCLRCNNYGDIGSIDDSIKIKTILIGKEE